MKIDAVEVSANRATATLTDAVSGGIRVVHIATPFAADSTLTGAEIQRAATELVKSILDEAVATVEAAISS